MIHFDTKRLPLLKRKKLIESREYLFAGIDDFSRELYASILPDKTQYSAKKFLNRIIVPTQLSKLILIMAQNIEKIKKTVQFYETLPRK